MSRVRIVPVNAIEPAFLSRLASCLEERFLYTCLVERALAVPRSAMNRARGQMFRNALSAKILEVFPPTNGDFLLGITEWDMYKTSHRFIFGDADERYRLAIVSLHRLRSQFYGEHPDGNLLFQRTVKEGVHQLGRTLGLGPCFNSRCAMYVSGSIFDIDNKWSNFCELCDRRCRAQS
ncbi:MAG: hypothetical protein M3Z14_05860 [Candidatus Eremiobacteraeota bacterium]|nr:hypothetical protein [Candidatus Eremiobacteraeota bacterium]